MHGFVHAGMSGSMREAIAMLRPNPERILLGTDMENKVIAIYFAGPTSQLMLSPDQAEALAKELLERAKTLKLQQCN